MIIIMARGPCTFRKRDVTRALKAAEAAGMEVASIEIRKDAIILVTSKSPDTALNASNSWDTVLVKET